MQIRKTDLLLGDKEEQIEKTASGIIIPGNERQQTVEFWRVTEVVGDPKNDIKPGMRVMIGKGAGTPIEGKYISEDPAQKDLHFKRIKYGDVMAHWKTWKKEQVKLD